MDAYDIADLIQIRTYSAAGEGFKDAAGVLTDPTTVTLKVEEPDAVEITKTYALAEVSKESAGRYFYNFQPTKGGVHHYRWIGTGAVAAAFEGAFFVRSSRF